MGVYVYGFKKASRNILVDGVKCKVQHLSYMYKPNYSWDVSARYNRWVAVKESHAVRSFEDYDGGYIVIADVKDDDGKLTNLDGYEVYKRLNKALWYDTSDHGMETVGVLKKIGRSYHLIKDSE